MPTWLVPFVVVVFSAALASIGWLYRRMSKAEIELAELRIQVGPYWQVVQKVLSQRLTHHSRPEADALMVKLNNLTISPSETIYLKQLMVERSRDFSNGITVAERETAIHFAWIMDQVILEAATLEGKKEEKSNDGD